jgi:UDP:flavonoid glycosyltransferase YjiC (YdhE family)
LKALAQLDAEVLCVAPGMSPAAAKRYATKRLRIALVPVDLAGLLENADIALSYGNSGFSTQSLLAGVPLAMRPRHVEQALFARRVETLGAGKLLNGPVDTDGVTALLQDLLGNSKYTQAARTFQSHHSDFSLGQAIEQSLHLIERTYVQGKTTNEF